MATTDAELVTRARAGEVDALGVLLDRYRVPLYATAMALLGDREAALDAVQDAYLVALTRLDGLRDPGAVGGWLRTIVRNCGLMHLRRTRHEIVSDDVDLASLPGPEQVLEDHALRDWIWTTLDTLTEEDRVAVVLRHFTRCRSYEAIAAVTAVPVGTVRSRLNRARRLLVHALTAGADRAQRDQAGLEAVRRQQWQSFYEALHETPEPRTYRDLYRRDVAVKDPAAMWRGVEEWSAEERAAIDIGVRADIVGLAASADLTIVEVDFHNPPWAASHCPPSSTFVHRLRDGRSACVDIYYHGS